MQPADGQPQRRRWLPWREVVFFNSASSSLFRALYASHNVTFSSAIGSLITKSTALSHRPNQNVSCVHKFYQCRDMIRRGSAIHHKHDSYLNLSIGVMCVRAGLIPGPVGTLQVFGLLNSFFSQSRACSRLTSYRYAKVVKFRLVTLHGRFLILISLAPNDLS
jgi:hypothetical protein